MKVIINNIRENLISLENLRKEIKETNADDKLKKEIDETLNKSIVSLLKVFDCFLKMNYYQNSKKESLNGKPAA